MASFMYRLLAIVLLVATGHLHAKEESVVLSVPGMKCPACPVTVMVAIQRVAGVNSVNVDFESKLATVSYDDQLTDVIQLQEAAKNMGFDSYVVSVE
jgi:mercuric ion binding protein